jgi:anti-sigma B factor antagonist
MELTIHDNHRVTVIMVSGEGEELDHLLTEGPRKLVIDLGRVGFMNSSALATLVHHYKLARSNCGDISLAALQPSVRQVFQLSCLERVFDLQPDVARAVQRFTCPQQVPEEQDCKQCKRKALGSTDHFRQSCHN